MGISGEQMENYDERWSDIEDKIMEAMQDDDVYEDIEVLDLIEELNMPDWWKSWPMKLDTVQVSLTHLEKDQKIKCEVDYNEHDRLLVARYYKL